MSSLPGQLPSSSSADGPLVGPARIDPTGAVQERLRGLAAEHLTALEAGARGEHGAEQERRLGRLRTALWRSPFWRARLLAQGGSPNDLQRIEDLRALPVLEREGLVGAGFDLVSWPGAEDRPAAEERFVVTSSGTTGAPVRLVRDAYDGVHAWVVAQHLAARHGRPLPAGARAVLLCALPAGLEYGAQVPLLGGARGEAGRLERISTVRPRPAERLATFSPHLLQGDPASLHWLRGAGVELPALQLVLSSAQPLSRELQGALAAWCGAPVVDLYATTEVGPIAWGCLQTPGHHHLLAPDVEVELVGGRVVVDRLREAAFPLLRFATGDTAEALIEGRCRCGQVGRTLVGLRGRRACRFLRALGGEFDAWELAWAFKQHPLAAFQLVQRSPSRFELRLAGAEEPAPLLALLRAALAREGCPEAELTLLPWVPDTQAKPEPFLRAPSETAP